jgi:hypothetical protein
LEGRYADVDFEKSVRSAAGLSWKRQQRSERLRSETTKKPVAVLIRTGGLSKEEMTKKLLAGLRKAGILADKDPEKDPK